MLANTRSIAELVNWWVTEYNSGGEWVAAVAGEDLEWIERPTSTYPNGRSGGKGFLIAAARRNLELMQDRRLNVVRAESISEFEGLVEYTHVGTTRSGTELVFVGISFLTFGDDRLRRQVDYVVRFRRAADGDPLTPY